MANELTTLRTRRISDLASIYPFEGVELFPVLQEGGAKKADMYSLVDYIRKQDFATWVLVNSSRETRATNWVMSNSSIEMRATTW